MNYTQSFDEFAMGLGPTDLALYAGAGIVLYILFKDKLSPVQKMLLDGFEQVKEMLKSDPKPVVVVPKVVPAPTVAPVVKSAETNDVFFSLVASWKQTRDLAVKSGCEKAVEVADQMFPFLSPSVCEDAKQ